MSPVISPLRPRERSHRPALGRAFERTLGGRDEPAADRVLLAGADASQRVALRIELGATLPARTRFCEAGQVTEVLERAPSSQMVILTGDLDDADAESLVRLLGHRHPRLPVVRIEPEPGPGRTGAGGYA